MTDSKKQKDAPTTTEGFPESNPNPVLSAGSDGKPEFINPATLQLLHDLGLENVEDILPTHHRKIVKACLNTNTQLKEKARVADSTIIWSYHPVADSKMVYIYGHDISAYCSDTHETKTLPELNPSPVLSFGPDGELLFFNPATTLLIQSFNMEHVEDVLPDNHKEIIKTCLEKGMPHTEEYRIANRTIVWSYQTIDENEVINLYGHDVSDYCSRIDITENLPTANPNPVLSTDSKGKPGFANPAILHLLGQLKLDNVMEILPDNHKNLVMACLKTSTPLTEERIVEGRTIVWSYHPVPTSDVVYIYGHDVSDYRSNKANNNAELLPILNPSPVLSTRPNGEMLFMNPATSQLLQELKLEHIGDLLPANHHEVIKTCLNTSAPLAKECVVAGRTIVWSYHPVNENDVIYIYGHDVSDYH